MAVKIRLSRIGKKKLPYYRVVVSDIHNKRDGRQIEIIGTYTTITNPPIVKIKKDRVDYWLSHGAQLSDTVRHLLQ